MQRHPEATRRRLERARDELAARVHRERAAPDELLAAGPVGRITVAEAQALELRPAAPGIELGPAWATWWFRVRATVPAAWDARRVDLLWDSRSEATLWVDGVSRQGLNAGPHARSGPMATLPQDRTEATLRERARGGDRLEAWVEVACGTAFGQEGAIPLRTVGPALLEQCELAAFDADAWELAHDFAILQALEAHLDGDLEATWRGRLLHELNRFCTTGDRAILRELLATHNAAVVHELSAVGHGHIDTAWLWPVAETYRKCVRTFSSATAAMERYPEFRFACSQAQQYAWVKARNPELYARIRARARAGQWVPVGGTWVEPDCNLPSGESLVRQFLHGQRFFEAEFGARCREFWNPDVFGYNGQLPQLMRGAGIRRFLTQKLSWNAFTKPPYHTFRWAGIDGSEVLAHFPPADTYNAEVTVPELRFNARNYKDHDRSAHSLMLFGHGDGGGGPTPAMLERLRRANDLEGLPRTVQRTPQAFFDLLEAETEDWPTVVGELYFEYHRGTYTTQAETKRAHRKAEVLLHDVEALAAVAARVTGAPYPADALRALWERVLLTQFHDILPGSSIAEVYADALADLEVVRAEGRRLRATALAALAGGDGTVRPVNVSGRARREVAATPEGALRVVAVPALGAGDEVAPGDAVSVQRDGDAVVLVNGALRAALAPGGDLVGLVHRPTGREALAGPAAVFELYDDRPAAWDAWDLDPSHLETGRPVGPATSCTVTAEGPLRAEVVFERPLTARSHLRETVRLDAHAARLEVHCEVDWHDQHRALKVAVPVAVRSMTATFEMQFGVAERPTHFNTAADLARFEVPAHRFADLSEHGFGVALLSESKYGFSAHGDTLRMTLLRGPVWPDPQADQGRHAFAFAVLPHAGGWQDGGVVHDARAFNQPLLWGGLPASPRPWLACEDDGLVLDTVKRSEDGEALVVRLYETHGARGTAVLRLGLPVAGVRRANLLEDPGEELALEDGRVALAYRPFEVVTLLLA